MSGNPRRSSRRRSQRSGCTPCEALTLHLGSEEYGIDILSAQEIRSCEPRSRNAGPPPHTLAVTHLHGVIVADAVSAVEALTSQQTKPTPAFNGSVNTGHTTSFTTPGQRERSRVPIPLDIANPVTDANRALGAQTPGQSP